MQALVSIAIADALMEIGVLAAGETVEAADQQLALRYLQRQIDSMAADRLSISAQLRTVFTLLNGTTAVTLGPSGATVTMDRPMWIDAITYLIPGATPTVEAPIALYDEAAFVGISIKALSSALPVAAFYQTNVTNGNGTLTFWPQVSQDVSIVLYTPQAVGVPASVNTVLIGPPGYAEAFHYQLAKRLCKPFGVQPDQLLVDNEREATLAMKRPNIRPPTLGMDPALTRYRGYGYNILSDS